MEAPYDQTALFNNFLGTVPQRRPGFGIKVNQSQRSEKIICVTRGGLFPAAVLARELEIRWIDTICVVGYDEESRGSHASLLKVPETDGEGVLVVDDLVDSGRTGRIIRELMPKAHFVTMYAKPKGQEVVDDFVVSVDQDTWILFPWEAELSPASPLVRRQED